MIFQFVIIILVFFIENWLCYKVTEEWGLPSWLQYKPFNCRMCCTFWSLSLTFIIIGISFDLWITLIGGISLSILNAIAMYIHQKNNTVKVI